MFFLYGSKIPISICPIYLYGSKKSSFTNNNTLFYNNVNPALSASGRPAAHRHSGGDNSTALMAGRPHAR